MKHDHSAFEAALAYRTDASDRVRQFTPLVRRMAWHFAGSTADIMEVEDLVQIGTIALLEAVRRHDRPGEDGFAAYAKMRVRGAMLDAIRAARRGSRRMRALRRRVEEARAALAGENAAMPTVAQIAGRAGIPAPQVAQIERAAEPCFAPFDPAEADSDPAFADPAADSLAAIIAREDHAALTAAIAELPDRLKLIVQCYFVEELNLAEIAAILRVSVPRIHQLKADALHRLRTALAGAAEGNEPCM